MGRYRGAAAAARVGSVALSAVLLAGGLAATADAAGPAVTCGATLHRDAVLGADLYCPRDGVVLAPGVTLDLGGHKLQGSTNGTAVTIPVGRASAVVNGRIRDFAVAVDFQPDPQDFGVRAVLSLRKLTISAAQVNAQAADVTIEDSRLSKAPVQASNATITAVRSVLEMPGERPVFNGELNHFVLDGSTVLGRVNNDENQDVTVLRSVLDGKNTTLSAAWCTGSALEIRQSTVKHYAQPVSVGGCTRAEIENNTFRDNPHGAVVVYGGDTPARITGNTFRTNGGAALAGEAMLASGNTFERNAVALSVDGTAFVSVVSANRFTGNRGNGLEVTRGSIRIRGNAATGNGGYGIYAPKGQDLGGNVARDNAAGDCVGVVCAAR